MAWGHRIHGDRRRRKRGIGWDFVHVAIDDASRLSYVEVLSEECGVTAAGFLERAIAWYDSCGIQVRKLLTDNGSCYVSSAFTQLCLRLGIRYSRTEPYRPKTSAARSKLLPSTCTSTITTELTRHLVPFAWLDVTNVVRTNT